MYRSSDGGKRWRPVDAPAPGLLTWNARGLFLAGLDGRVWSASGPESPWRSTAEALGEPVAAWDSGPDGELLAALHDGSVKQSDDAGRSWATRLEPG